MSRVSKDFETARVLDPGGQPVEIASLWKDRPALFVFLRHFG